jgi:fructose-1,6-bisphosphatase/inositol monophosphatase family enzyme
MIQQQTGIQIHPATFLGPMTFDASGKLLRMIGIDAMNHVRRVYHDLETFEKQGDDGEPDVYTNVDVSTQEPILSSIRACYPLFGIVAEEGEYLLPCSHPQLSCWTSIDSNDGSREMARGGIRVSVMIAHMIDGVIEGVFIGEPFTGRYIYTRIGSHKVHLFDLHNHDARRVLTSISPEQRRPLGDSKIATRKPRNRHGTKATRLLLQEGRFFKGWEEANGSIGSMFIRLWTGEISAILMPRGKQKAWDWWPVVGVSRKLGYRWFYIDNPAPNTKNGKIAIKEYDPEISVNQVRLERDTIVIHKTFVQDLKAFEERLNAPT